MFISNAVGELAKRIFLYPLVLCFSVFQNAYRSFLVIFLVLSKGKAVALAMIGDLLIWLLLAALVLFIVIMILKYLSEWIAPEFYGKKEIAAIVSNLFLRLILLLLLYAVLSAALYLLFQFVLLVGTEMGYSPSR